MEEESLGEGSAHDCVCAGGTEQPPPWRIHQPGCFPLLLLIRVQPWHKEEVGTATRPLSATRSYLKHWNRSKIMWMKIATSTLIIAGNIIVKDSHDYNGYVYWALQHASSNTLTGLQASSPLISSSPYMAGHYFYLQRTKLENPRT